MPLLQRQVEQIAVKQRIGKVATSLVKDGDTVFLGSGTTVLEVACNLWERQNLAGPQRSWLRQLTKFILSSRVWRRI